MFFPFLLINMDCIMSQIGFVFDCGGLYTLLLSIVILLDANRRCHALYVHH